ncbi:MAG TPA: nuclear transport factor 2 family protein [Puia sp.]|nr:nuclear transport factor 2 family protein [Puia sp.]
MNIEQKLQQLEDRLAIRELIDQYAHCADTRDAQGQMALFTADTNFEVFMDEKSAMPTQVINTRKDLFPVFDNLNTYLATMHFNGQSTIKLDGDRASGITYCRAHHLNIQNGIQQLMIAGIRYYDIMVKQDEGWLFAERKLKVCWVENR